ncbi:hypothetical protein ABW19_dt0205013 [Dactylella cylindrospora]|nr:hypothetical protein ABW19_dt0205013 [Dactylella cylindrospora]
MRLSSAISTILLSAALVGSQAVPNNDINFSTVSIYGDLKRCLKAVFVLDYGVNDGTVQRKIGCETNECLCRPDTLEQAITTAGSMALSQCSNSNDKLSATSILTEYCSEKGLGGAVATPTDDAGAAVTVFATTTVAMITATETVTVSSASKYSGSTATSARTSQTPKVVVETTNIVATISGSPTTIFSTVTSTTTPTQGSSGSQGPNDGESKQNLAGPIAGGVVGGIAVIAGAILLVFFLRRRKPSHQYAAAEQGLPPQYDQVHMSNPYGGMDRGSKVVGGIQEYR